MARLCNDYGAGMHEAHPGHFGLFATFPMLDVDASLRELDRRRVVMYSHPQLAQLAPDGMMAEFRRLYYDTANAVHAPSMATVLALAPAGHVVWGSDYPYVAMDRQLDALAALGLPVSQREAIESGNALRLLPGLARAA